MSLGQGGQVRAGLGEDLGTNRGSPAVWGLGGTGSGLGWGGKFPERRSHSPLS